MTKKKMLVADLLCGAGGSSTGASRAMAALGLDMELVCVNHWQTAIETHQRNHPEARHYVEDIATVRPHLLVPEGYLDLLMASPTCTHHSVARGGKPTSDQQRSDPWHIITWLTELRVKRLIIENVWEFTGWGPVDHRTERPVKSRKGEYFAAWIATMRGLGYDPEWRKLNAANYGDATTRQRFILKARNDRKVVGWAPITHQKRGDMKNDMFGAVAQQWRPASEIIDWSISGKSIFNRKKPLAPKTLARIYAGMVKNEWPAPYLVILRNHMAVRGLDSPLPTISAGGTHIGIAQPILLSQHNSGAPRSVEDPLPTITTGGASAANHPGCARPMLVTIAHGNSPGDATADSRRVHDIEDPVGTIGAGGNTFAVVEPFILNRHGDNGGGIRAHSVAEPMPTATDRGAGYVIEPFVLSRHAGGAPRSVDEPTPTQVAKQSHLLISPYYGSGSGETCRSGDEPLPTATSKARFGMVVPVTHSTGGNIARNLDDPLPTLTTAKGGEFAFITAQHGERPGQAPRTHDLAEPVPTIAATGHVDLVEPGEQFDILFRMLEPHELAAAMGFNDGDEAYQFAGTKTDQIKQIGNAVSVSMMKAEVGAIFADVAQIVSLAEAA